MIVLDTNVLSEMMKSSPAAGVLRWWSTHRASELFTTTITQAEILYGLEVMATGKRRAALQLTAEKMLVEDFADRVLPFDTAAARLFATIAGARRVLGRPMAQWDAPIAAIARSRGATLATRDSIDFEQCRIRLVNPWMD